jgi:hypothetical protein
MPRKEFIALAREGDEDDEVWLCSCGNTPSGFGFFPYEKAPREGEPVRELRSCASCGRLIDPDTLEVVAPNYGA